jgi:hypothetical protein
VTDGYFAIFATATVACSSGIIGVVSIDVIAGGGDCGIIGNVIQSPNECAEGTLTIIMGRGGHVGQ